MVGWVGHENSPTFERKIVAFLKKIQKNFLTLKDAAILLFTPNSGASNLCVLFSAPFFSARNNKKQNKFFASKLNFLKFICSRPKRKQCQWRRKVRKMR